MKYKVTRGSRYAARIHLGGFEVLASNTDIYNKLKEVGLVDITVSGSGTERIAQATWPHDDKVADLPAEIAAQRLSGTRVPDKFEAQPQAFFQRVSNGYLQRMLESPARFARIDAAQTREAVWGDVLSALQHRGWLA